MKQTEKPPSIGSQEESKSVGCEIISPGNKFRTREKIRADALDIA